MTTFTPGGHGFGESEGLAMGGVPHQPDMGEGAGMSMGGMFYLNNYWMRILYTYTEVCSIRIITGCVYSTVY